jgi:hypothetical protein
MAGPLNEVLLYDVHGRVVMNIKEAGQELTIQTYRLPPGVYHLSVSGSSGRGHLRLIRQ